MCAIHPSTHRCACHCQAAAKPAFLVDRQVCSVTQQRVALFSRFLQRAPVPATTDRRGRTATRSLLCFVCLFVCLFAACLFVCLMVGLLVQIGSDDLTKWAGESGDWVPMEAEAQMSYIDLTKNPEVNKGYVPPPLVRP